MRKLLTLIGCCVAAVAQAQYIWYPGNLAAHLQEVQKKACKARCVNVDYPGNFMQPSDTTWFRQRQSSGCYSDAKRIVNAQGLPTLYVSHPDRWQVSLDGRSWHAPAIALYNDSLSRPVEMREERQLLLPKRVTMGQIDDFRTIRYDFEEEELGVCSVHASGRGTVWFVVGESLEETACRDTTTFEQRNIAPFVINGEQDLTLPIRALRYVTAFITGNVELSDMQLQASLWPVQETLTFRCSDEEFNRIYRAGVKTLHTAMHNFYLDGIKRDFLPWAMDGIIATLAGDYLFSDRQVGRNCIAVAFLPPHPTKKDLGVVDYPLHALIGILNDYLRFGDLSTAMLFRDRIEEQLAFYETLQDEQGFIHAAAPTWGFIPGWSTDNGPEKMGVAAYAQIMLYENFGIAAFFERQWGNRQLAAHYETKAAQLRQSIMRCFWNAGQQAFVNGYLEDGTLDRRVSHHTQYWAVLANMFPKKSLDHLYTDILPKLKNYKTNVSYEKGYEFLAYIKAGRVREMTDLLKEVWGGWLNEGFTRYPENFSIKSTRAQQLSFYGRPYALSLCHGANGAPPVIAAFRGILGFQQDVRHPGQYTFRPQLLDMSFAEGTIPVKEGTIKVHFSANGKSTLTVPSGCEVTVTLKGMHKIFTQGNHTF